MAAGAEDPDRNPDTTVREHICFLCKTPCLPRDKIRVFGRSSLEISALIARATKVDLSVYAASDREKAIICNTTCYKRLGKYQNVVRKLDAIVGEIQRDFRGRGLSRGKRLASEQNRPLGANKRIKIENLPTSSSVSPRETLPQAPTLQIGGKSNSCTEATVHVVYGARNSINTASNVGSSVSTFGRPSPILAADNIATKPEISVTFARPPSVVFAKGVNTAAKPGICFTTAFTQLSSLLTTTQPGISVTTFARPSPVLPGASSVNTTTEPGISLTTFARPSPILAVRNTVTKPAVFATTFTRPSPVLATTNSVNTATQPGISITTSAGPSPALAAANSVNTATQPGISLSTFTRPPVLAATNSVNTVTQPGISNTTSAGPSPALAAANSVNTTTQPGISLGTFARPPVLAAATSMNTAARPGISVAMLDRPSLISTAANSVNTASKPGISVTTLDRLPISRAANSVNTASKPRISVSTLDRPISTAANSVNTASKPGISVTTLDKPISTAANSVNTATKPGISVTLLDRPPISTTASSVNTASKPEILVTTLDRPISTAANSVNTVTKPGISVTALGRPPISTAANSANTASKPGISVTTLLRPAIPATAYSVNTATKPVTSVFLSDPLVNFTADQLFTVLPLQAQKPEEKQEIRIRICVDYPSKPVRKELKSELHVLAKAMVDGNHQRIAGAALKIDGVKELVIEKVIKLMTVQVDELCSKHRPSMLRPTSRNTNDEAKDFDYKKMCSEWKERAPIFHAFLTACAAIKNSRKKNSPECLPGVAVAGTVLLKQRNTQMNAGFAKILGFLIRSKSLEVGAVSCCSSLFSHWKKWKQQHYKQNDCTVAHIVCYLVEGEERELTGALFCSIPFG